MNRNQRGCGIVIRRHDSRGCYGKRAETVQKVGVRPLFETGGAPNAPRRVLSALVLASIAGSMKGEIFQAASNTLRTVAVRRRKWNPR
jgi:hypothetical protein